MNSEPSFIARTEQDPELYIKWIEECAKAARDKGCTFCRAAYDTDNDRRIIFEAWVERPDDQGPIRWDASVTESAADD